MPVVKNSILKAEVTQLEELDFMNRSIITNSIALRSPIQSVNTCINSGAYLHQNFTCDGIPYENMSVTYASNPDFSMATPTLEFVVENLDKIDSGEIGQLVSNEDDHLFNASNEFLKDRYGGLV
ncbi:hypothetical protein M5689_015827 [Euphorbia peplus]|nr:hypothetical protein M5689_015827 [Euphorbia peplus]